MTQKERTQKKWDAVGLVRRGVGWRGPKFSSVQTVARYGAKTRQSDSFFGEGNFRFTFPVNTVILSCAFLVGLVVVTFVVTGQESM